MGTNNTPFVIGDYVMYKTYGICIITSIEDKDFGAGPRPYYTLKLVNPPESIFYVPCDLDNLHDAMRLTIDKDTIISSILESDTIDEIWIPDNKRRTLEYESILLNGTISQKLYIYKVLSQKKEENIINKKKMYICDSKVLTTVERLITQEFAHVLNIPINDVVPFILDTLSSSN